MYVTETVGSVSQTDALNVVLHADQGKLWMDWRHSDEEFAYSEFDDDAWSSTVAIPWTDDSWLKLEEVRLCIRSVVFAP